MNKPSDKLTARVFFALWPGAAEQRQLAEWQAQLERLYGGRAMRRETLHNTLAFLGEIKQARLEALQLAAQEIGGERFELRFDEARYWGHNHIVYAAPRHVPRQLLELVNTLGQRLSAHRFKFDDRDYQPHVTLLRNARWNDAPSPSMHPVCWQINDFALVQSVQQDGSNDYRVLVRFPLRPAGG